MPENLVQTCLALPPPVVVDVQFSLDHSRSGADVQLSRLKLILQYEAKMLTPIDTRRPASVHFRSVDSLHRFVRRRVPIINSHRRSGAGHSAGCARIFDVKGVG